MTLPFALEIAVNIQDDKWKDLIPDLDECCSRTATLTLECYLKQNAELNTSVNDSVVEVSFLFTDDEAVQVLNSEFRNIDKPTNVLSFPDTELSYLELEESSKYGESLIFGDIALARETIVLEARMQNKNLCDHLIHLLVHGILHLAGYDHISDDDADIMEGFEIQILKQLGIPNPYEAMQVNLNNMDSMSK